MVFFQSLAHARRPKEIIKHSISASYKALTWTFSPYSDLAPNPGVLGETDFPQHLIEQIFLPLGCLTLFWINQRLCKSSNLKDSTDTKDFRYFIPSA